MKLYNVCIKIYDPEKDNKILCSSGFSVEAKSYKEILYNIRALFNKVRKN